MKSWELQVAIKTKLDATSGLTDLLSNGTDSIRDDIREDDGFPYISIYDLASNENDTQVGNGIETLISIHAYSRYDGMKEVKQIMDEVYGALHSKSLTISGDNHISTRFSSSNTFLEADGKTRHGTINFVIDTSD